MGIPQKALDIIEIAKKRKLELEKANLEKEIAERQAEVNLEQAKEKSAIMQLESIEKERAQVTTAINELQKHKDLIPQEDYDLAQQELTSAMSGADQAVEKQHETISSLRIELRTKITALDQLRDRLRVIVNPFAAPKYAASKSSMSDDFFLEQCQPNIQEMYRECVALPNLIASKDIKHSHLQCIIHAAKTRRLMDNSGLGEADKTILRRCLGKVSTVTKDTMCGICKPLQATFSTDWSKLLSETLNDLMEHDRIVERRNATKHCPVPIPKRVEKEDLEAKQREMELVRELMSAGIIERTRGKRLTLIGYGQGKTQQTEWLGNAMELKRINVFTCDDVNNGRCHDDIIASIQNKGTDMVVIFTKWLGHARSGPIVQAAQRAEIPMAHCHMISTEAICRAVIGLFSHQEAAIASGE